MGDRLCTVLVGAGYETRWLLRMIVKGFASLQRQCLQPEVVAGVSPNRQGALGS
jgi:hypothetical protein